MNNNYMILNGVNLGISKMALDNGALVIYDKAQKYCLSVFIYYNWPDINKIKVGHKARINFNEYILSENNEPALILPTQCYVEKIINDSLSFYFDFENMAETIHYMNQRNCFDIVPHSLEIKVLIDYNDAKNGSIIYEY